MEYSDKRPALIALVTQACIDARLDEVFEDGTCWCSDSNGAMNVPELVDKILQIVGIDA